VEGVHALLGSKLSQGQTALGLGAGRAGEHEVAQGILTTFAQRLLVLDMTRAVASGLHAAIPALAALPAPQCPASALPQLNNTRRTAFQKRP